MSATSPSNLANILVTLYDREYMAQHERVMTRFYDRCMEFESGGEPVGKERKWGIRTGDSHATGAVVDGGDFPDFDPPTVLNATITAKITAASVQWTEMMLRVGRAEGTISAEDIIDDHVKMTVRNIMFAMNRHALGHGTGRVGVLASTTVASTTVPCRQPEGVLQFRKGQKVAFFDLDTGGTQQGATETIASINFEAATFEIGNARSLTAGWGIYIATKAGTSPTSKTEYGIVPTGLRGINDNGELALTLFGITRSSNPQVNATRLKAGSASSLQGYSEKLVRKGINRIFYTNSMVPDEIWTNQGIIGEHLNHLTGNRLFTVSTTEGVPTYKIGHDERKLAFHHNGKDIPFIVEADLPARELHLICSSLYRKHVLQKPAWVGDDTGPDGSPKPILMQAPSGSSYSLNKVAGMMAAVEYGHKLPAAGCAISEVFDEELAGDAAAA